MVGSYGLRAALATLFLALSAGSAAAQITGRVGGVVRDDGGRPIKGAMIVAEHPNTGPATRIATTDDRGRFTMIGLRPGRWKFLAWALGHAAGLGEMVVRWGQWNPSMTFVLRKNGPTADAPLGNISGKDLQAQLASADALFGQQKWDEAIAAYRTIIARTPALSVINLQIAAAYRSKKEYAAAIAAYESLLRVDPENEKATVGIGMTNLEKGDRRAAEKTLLKAAEGASAGRELFYNLGAIKLAQGDADQAVVWYQKAAAADPSWGKPLYELGEIARQKGDTERAATLMSKVVAVDPTSPEAALAKAALAQLP